MRNECLGDPIDRESHRTFHQPSKPGFGRHRLVPRHQAFEFKVAKPLRRQTILMSDSTFPGPTTATRSIRPTAALELAAASFTPTFRLDRRRSQTGDHPARGRASKHGIETGRVVEMAAASLIDDPRQTRDGDEVPIRRLECQQSGDQAVSDRRSSTTSSGRLALGGGTILKTLQERTPTAGRAIPVHAEMRPPTGVEKIGKPVHRTTSGRSPLVAAASASSEDQRQSVSLCCSTRVHLPFAVGVSRENSPRRTTCPMT